MWCHNPEDYDVNPWRQIRNHFEPGVASYTLSDLKNLETTSFVLLIVPPVSNGAQTSTPVHSNSV
jgi:hypothetical protein